jgi:hypothetical protein
MPAPAAAAVWATALRTCRHETVRHSLLSSRPSTAASADALAEAAHTLDMQRHVGRKLLFESR